LSKVEKENRTGDNVCRRESYLINTLNIDIFVFVQYVFSKNAVD